MTLSDIQQRILQAVPDAEVHVLDPMQDGQHLQALVISPIFEGMPVFKQQQMVMAAIKDIFSVVHALGLKTFTPTKWQEVKHTYVN